MTVSEVKFEWAEKCVSPRSPVYMGEAYQEMFASLDKAEARVVELSRHGEVAWLPLLVRDLGHGSKEAYSAYGYGGVLGSLTLSEDDVQGLRQFLAESGIVAVFIRHAPFIANQHRWPAEWIELNRITYAVDLQPYGLFDDFLRTLPQKIRWSVNFARRSGLEVIFRRLSESPELEIKNFYRLYSELMREKQTADYYLFSEEFFLEHVNRLSSQCELAEIVDPTSGELLAAAFFLIGTDGWVHYHLSAAKRDAMKQQAMELLIASAIFRYGLSACQSLHLGGGHALDESDGLSRFKAKFATRRLDFCCTKLICDEDAYQREREREPLKRPGYFLISDARQ